MLIINDFGDWKSVEIKWKTIPARMYRDRNWGKEGERREWGERNGRKGGIRTRIKEGVENERGREGRREEGRDGGTGREGRKTRKGERPLTREHEDEDLQVEVEGAPRRWLVLRHGRDDRDVVLRVRRVEQRVEAAGPRRDLCATVTDDITSRTT